MKKLEVGTKIRIISLYESKDYKGAEGIITKNPYPNVFYGTWGKEPIFTHLDKFEVIEECGGK